MVLLQGPAFLNGALGHVRLQKRTVPFLFCFLSYVTVGSRLASLPAVGSRIEQKSHDPHRVEGKEHHKPLQILGSFDSIGQNLLKVRIAKPGSSAAFEPHLRAHNVCTRVLQKQRSLLEQAVPHAHFLLYCMY